MKIIFVLLMLISCGKNDSSVNQLRLANSQIIGGWPDTANLYHFVVRVDLNGKAHCSGVAIDDLTVITAGHCVDKGSTKARNLTVIVSTAFTTKIQVVKAYVRKEYILTEDGQYDLAIMKLKLPMGLISYPRLPTNVSSMLLMKNYVNSKQGQLFEVGFGMIDSLSGALANNESRYYVNITKELLWQEGLWQYLSSGKGTSYGDSGGAMFVKYGPEIYLLGIIHGSTVRDGDQYDVNAPISNYTEANIEKDFFDVSNLEFMY